MSHATSGMPARPVALDWRHGSHRPARTRACCAATPALCRSPVKACPATRAAPRPGSPPTRAAHLTVARLIRAYTPGRGEPR